MCSFEVGKKLYARSFGSNKGCIPVVVKSKTGLVSYWVRANDGQLLCRHLDQLRKQYQAKPDQRDKIDLDWPYGQDQDNPYHCNRLHLRTQLHPGGQLRPDSLCNTMLPCLPLKEEGM